MRATDQHLRALAFLASDIRPTGSPRWKPEDIYDCADRLRQKGFGLTEITNRALVHAQDAKAKAPTVMVAAPRHEPEPESRHARPPKRADECPHHPGQWSGSCGGCAVDAATGTPKPPARHVKSTPPPEWHRARAALRGGTEEDQ